MSADGDGDVTAARAALAGCGTLAEVIRAGLALRPAWTIVDVVVQDEFTHDVIVAPEGAGADGPVLVLDCT